MKKPLIIACVIIVIVSLLSVSLVLKLPSMQEPAQATPTPHVTAQPTMQPTPGVTIDPANQTLQQAINNAIRYCKQIQEPYGLLMLNVIYRQFGIQEFNDSLQRYDDLIAMNSNAGLWRVFRRVLSSDTSSLKPEDFNMVIEPLDRLTVPALYADAFSLPPDYLDQLTEAVNRGEYFATHALMATIWLQNNHSTLELPQSYLSSLYQTNADLIGDGSTVDDLQLEAAAFLYEAGQGNRVNPAFIENVLAAQYSNGGWSSTHNIPYNTYWHPTVLGLLLLLYIAHPAASYPPMVAPASS